MDEGLYCSKPMVTGFDSTALVRLYMVQKSIGPLDSDIRNQKFIGMFAGSPGDKGQILLIAVTVTSKRIMRLILDYWYIFRKISHEPVTYK
ncbi:MAG: hypothetical protein VB054_05275 [Petrimonas sp.]|nr:hypothetical protein [Petrimonas sp.]